jgi:Clp amino terminal domain, pathogenicity island component
VGIDVDAVRDRMTETFGPEALSRAGHAVRGRPVSRPRWDPRRSGPGISDNGVFLPHSSDALECLRTVRAVQRAHRDTQIGVGVLAMSLLAVDTGLVPPILAALGTPAATLRAAVTDACRATGEPPQR